MLGKNEKTENLGFWPEWFRKIMDQHGEVYSSQIQLEYKRDKKGDVIVGWRRGSDNPGMWNDGRSMLIIGDSEPSQENWEAAGVGERTGESRPLWLSYIAFCSWQVIAEGKRGKYRPFGVLYKMKPTR